MTRSTKHIFHAFSAYVGQLTGQTTCKFWPDDPSCFGWDITRAFAVDLSKTPSAARAGKIKWEEVEVDDHSINAGLTTIGPLFPGGEVIGGVWLHEQHMKKLGLDTSNQPQHAYDYELRCVLYDCDPHFGDRRFQGFHARLVGSPAQAGSQQVHRLQVWDAGHAKAKGQAPMWWVDMADAAHPTESTVGSKTAPLEGSLYLDVAKKRTYLAGGGNGPKIPATQGYGD